MRSKTCIEDKEAFLTSPSLFLEFSEDVINLLEQKDQEGF